MNVVDVDAVRRDIDNLAAYFAAIEIKVGEDPGE